MTKQIEQNKQNEEVKNEINNSNSKIGIDDYEELPPLLLLVAPSSLSENNIILIDDDDYYYEEEEIILVENRKEERKFLPTNHPFRKDDVADTFPAELLEDVSSTGEERKTSTINSNNTPAGGGDKK